MNDKATDDVKDEIKQQMAEMTKGMTVKDLIVIENMLTPKVITLVYWLLLVVTVIGGISMMFSKSFIGGLIAIIAGVVVVRIWCELFIVLFKMNEALQDMRSK